MKTIGDQAIGWSPGFSIAYETDSLWGLNVHFEYCYTRSVATDAMQFIVTSSTGPQAISSFGADIIFSTHNLDLAACFRPHDFLNFAIGPSISLVHRTIDLTVPARDPSPGRLFQDRLALLCLGVNGSVNIEFSIEEGLRHFFIFSGLKLRYLHSVWFDKRGRNLNDFYQGSLLGQMGIGLGYSF